AKMKKDKIEKGNYLTGAANEIVITYEVPREMRDVEKEKREERKRRANERAGRPNNMGGGGGFGGEGPEMPAAFNAVGKTGTLVMTRDFEDANGDRKFEKKEVRVRVVGQFEKEQNSRFGRGPVAYVPLAMVDELNKWVEEQDRRTFGGEQRKKTRADKEKKDFETIFVKVDKRENVEKVVEHAQRIGYEIYSPARELKEINKFFFVIQLILGGIAAISLLVATIGIVNTMIMSILERTKEIGIMKVIGATVYNIRWLFLIESGFIGLIGGITGLALAYGAVEILNYVAASNPDFNMFGGRGMPDEGEPTKLAVIPYWLSLFAIGFSFVIGLLAGIFPAFRASRLSPLQAIRSE
ncbi:MAG: ABC transporter permease, partial [Clostridia bacterium]